MKKKQYQQPMTVSTQLEPCGILCGSPAIGAGNGEWKDGSGW